MKGIISGIFYLKKEFENRTLKPIVIQLRNTKDKLSKQI